MDVPILPRTFGNFHGTRAEVLAVHFTNRFGAIHGIEERDEAKSTGFVFIFGPTNLWWCVVRGVVCVVLEVCVMCRRGMQCNRVRRKGEGKKANQYATFSRDKIRCSRRFGMW